MVKGRRGTSVGPKFFRSIIPSNHMLRFLLLSITLRTDSVFSPEWISWQCSYVTIAKRKIEHKEQHPLSTPSSSLLPAFSEDPNLQPIDKALFKVKLPSLDKLQLYLIVALAPLPIVTARLPVSHSEYCLIRKGDSS